MPDEEKTKILLNLQDHLGILYAKSFLKIIGILFILMELAWGKFPNLFVSMIFLFIIYFTMPTSYRKDEPYKASEAWFRMLVGFLIAITIFSFLSPGVNLFDPGLSGSVLLIIIVAIAVGAASYSFPSKWMTILAALLGVILITMGLSFIFPGKVLPDALPIFFITFAFLATAPKAEKEEGAEKIVVVGMEKGKPLGDISEKINSDNMENFGNGFFLTLMFAGGWPIISWVKGGLQLILGAVWIVSGFVGFMSGREGRPYIGILMIGFAVLAFSFQFTGTIGTAIFGNYWTPIYNTLSTTFEPFGKSLDAASRQVNFAMCTITAGPGVCDALINPPPASAGSTGALELLNFEAINYRTGSPEINPAIPLIGTIQLENQGDFAASDVKINLQAPKVFDAKKASLNDLEKGLEGLLQDECAFDSCFDGKNADAKTCTWDSTINKGEQKLLSFKCGSMGRFENGWASLLKQVCVDPRAGKTIGDLPADGDCGAMKAADSDTAPKACKCVNDKFKNYCKTNSNVLDSYCRIEDSACKKSSGDWDCAKPECSTACNGQATKAIIKYEKAGWNLRVGFDYSFKYSANVSLPVRVMEKQAFLDKLKAHQVVLEDVNPVYSGGPVSVGIWVGKQPIRTDDSTIGTVYLKNDGDGIVKANSILRLTLPSQNFEFNEQPKIVSKSFSFKGKAIANSIENCQFRQDEGKNLLDCPLIKDMNAGESGTITFSFNYKITDAATEKNTIFVGGLDYTYEKSKLFTFPIVAVPAQ